MSFLLCIPAYFTDGRALQKNLDFINRALHHVCILVKLTMVFFMVKLITGFAGSCKLAQSKAKASLQLMYGEVCYFILACVVALSLPNIRWPE